MGHISIYELVFVFSLTFAVLQWWNIGFQAAQKLNHSNSMNDWWILNKTFEKK